MSDANVVLFSSRSRPDSESSPGRRGLPALHPRLALDIDSAESPVNGPQDRESPARPGV